MSSAYLATRPFQVNAERVDRRSVKKYVYATPVLDRNWRVGRRLNEKGIYEYFQEYYVPEKELSWQDEERRIKWGPCLICKDRNHFSSMHRELSESTERYLAGSDRHLLDSVTGLQSRETVIGELRRLFD